MSATNITTLGESITALKKSKKRKIFKEGTLNQAVAILNADVNGENPVIDDLVLKTAQRIVKRVSKIVAQEARKKESELIERIAKRAFSLFGSGRSEMDYRFDLVRVHSGTCPLDLDRLLAAKEKDFIHDIAGIARHLNHSTGELENCFVPRFSM